MTDETPVDLLEKLCSGDAESAEQVFRAFEPYLRGVVRRQLTPRLRTKFDSLDVVQSVWADLVKGFRESGWKFADREHLKAFLVAATRHRLLDRIRQHRRAIQREEPDPGERAQMVLPSPEPRPSQVVEAKELWERILALSQPAHREILLLKHQGLSVAEIARRTGWHEDSIHRILRNLATQLSLRG